MRDLCRLIGWMVVDLIRSRVMLEAEVWTLRQQINVLPANCSKETLLLRRRPNDIRWSLSVVSKNLRCVGDRQAGHPCPLASCRVRILLTLEVETPWWPADCSGSREERHPIASDQNFFGEVSVVRATGVLSSIALWSVASDSSPLGRRDRVSVADV